MAVADNFRSLCISQFAFTIRMLEASEQEPVEQGLICVIFMFYALTESTKDSKNVLFQYESSKEIQVQNDSKATATLETETNFSRDARAIRERALKKAEEALKGKSKTSGDGKVFLTLLSQ